jgi:hypothetical protein
MFFMLADRVGAVVFKGVSIPNGVASRQGRNKGRKKRNYGEKRNAPYYGRKRLARKPRSREDEGGEDPDNDNASKRGPDDKKRDYCVPKPIPIFKRMVIYIASLETL